MDNGVRLKGENQLEEQEGPQRSMQTEDRLVDTAGEAEGAGGAESIAGHTHHHGQKQPARGNSLLCVQGAQPGLRDNLEGGRWQGGARGAGTHAYLWLVRVDLQEKPAQYCKANYPPIKTE